MKPLSVSEPLGKATSTGWAASAVRPKKSSATKKKIGRMIFTRPILTDCARLSKRLRRTRGGLGAELVEQLVDRGAGEDAIELRAKVRRQADIVDDDIVDFPLPVDAVQAIIDGEIFAGAVDDFGIDLRLVLIDAFAHKNNLLAAVGLERAHVRAFDKRGEHRDELVFATVQVLPAVAERPLRHLGEVEARQQDVADLFDRLVFVRAARGDDFLKDLRDALDGGLNLLRRLLGQR